MKKRKEEKFVERKVGAKGNKLYNHQVMGSLRMFGARGLLLIFIALGTNGQMLTEKIPLGKVFLFYGNLWITLRRREKIFSSLRNELLPFFFFSIHRQKHPFLLVFITKNVGFALWLFPLNLFLPFVRPRMSFMCLPENFLHPQKKRKKDDKQRKEEKQTEIVYDWKENSFLSLLGLHGRPGRSSSWPNQ